MTDWITNTISSLGYWGICLLMFLENIFPPIPSELIMPLVGFTISQGKMGFIPAIFAGVMGTILGTFPWYYAGLILNQAKLEKLADKYGKWLTISAKDIKKANNWFQEHGGKAVFFGRLVPGIRTVISLPAGMNEMSIIPFTIYSTIGSLIWILLLTLSGYILGNNYQLVEKYIGHISKIVLISLVIWMIIWFVRKRSK